MIHSCRLVSSYLVHHGFCKTAEAFDTATGQKAVSNAAAIRHRQQMQKLVLAGRIGDAIDAVNQAHPGLLQRRPHLLFLLHLQHLTELIAAPDAQPWAIEPATISPAPLLGTRRSSRHPSPSPHGNGASAPAPEQHQDHDHDVDMDSQQPPIVSQHSNGASTDDRQAEQRETDVAEGSGRNGVSVVAPALPRNLERVLSFGKELRRFYAEQLEEEGSVEERQMKEVFSLLCYPDPWQSPLAHLLRAEQRSPVAAALNSAILEEEGQPPRPPLHRLAAHAARLRVALAQHGDGAAAFATPLL